MDPTREELRIRGAAAFGLNPNVLVSTYGILHQYFHTKKSLSPPAGTAETVIVEKKEDNKTCPPASTSSASASIMTDIHRSHKAPETAYNLIKYRTEIYDRYSFKNRHLHGGRYIVAGDGKVNPAKYGGTSRQDLGLCHATFMTYSACEMGDMCPWRHGPLALVDEEWIVEKHGEAGRRFVENARRHWAKPEVPVPGTNLKAMMTRRAATIGERRGDM
ncbi:hypothetical protein BS50DRAFT_630177 [Corynespora cassiicola Philippines]|uniref:C3H1-type domain-containing protein n=1 Tax=Corynespora cassiicola Philippines TaxID=1448308 RepID=A0A2T2P323_CORCC|nr:hypothetical protein BS50DRAFT_630177 [Corynespora cassiicola Philippines]